MNFDKLMSGLAGSGVLGGLAGGAVSGALMSNKKARKTAGTVLKVGGLAALGGMAWKAYQDYQAEQKSAAGVRMAGTAHGAPAEPDWQNLQGKGFAIDTTDAAVESRALLLIQAMIAAACADGHMDNNERERIMQQVTAADLEPDEKALVFDTLHDPPSLVELGQRVDCSELAAEVYLASALAIDQTQAESELYLAALAHRLDIPEAMVRQIHAQLPPPRLETQSIQGVAAQV